MRSRTRTALFLAVIVGCISAAVGAAVALGHDDDSSRVPTRAETYAKGMTLDEIAKTASRTPGGIAPPCPDEATVSALKTAGKAFGPCDPHPEDGQPFRVPLEGQSEHAGEDAATCPGIILGKGVDLRIELACARGARIVDARAVKLDGAYCAKLTYIARTGSPSRTETLCDGDTPAAGGRVRGPD